MKVMTCRRDSSLCSSEIWIYRRSNIKILTRLWQNDSGRDRKTGHLFPPVTYNKDGLCFTVQAGRRLNFINSLLNGLPVFPLMHPAVQLYLQWLTVQVHGKSSSKYNRLTSLWKIQKVEAIALAIALSRLYLSEVFQVFAEHLFVKFLQILHLSEKKRPRKLHVWRVLQLSRQRVPLWLHLVGDRGKPGSLISRCQTRISFTANKRIVALRRLVRVNVSDERKSYDMIIILSVDCTVWNFRDSTEDLLDVCFMSFWSIRLFTLRQSVTYGCCCSFVESEGTLHQYLKSNWCHNKPVYFVFLTVSACGKSQITKETDFQKGFLKFQAMLRLFVAFMVCGQNTPQRAKPSSSDRSQINWRLITFITMITSSVCVCVCVCGGGGGLWRITAASCDVIHGLRQEKKCSQRWVSGSSRNTMRFGSEDDVWDFYCFHYLWVEKSTVQHALTAVKVEEVSKKKCTTLFYMTWDFMIPTSVPSKDLHPTDFDM